MTIISFCACTLHGVNQGMYSHTPNSFAPYNDNSKSGSRTLSAYVSVPCLLRCKPLTPRKSYGLVSKVYDEIDNKLNNPVVNVTTSLYSRKLPCCFYGFKPREYYYQPIYSKTRSRTSQRYYT